MEEIEKVSQKPEDEDTQLTPEQMEAMRAEQDARFEAKLASMTAENEAKMVEAMDRLTTLKIDFDPGEKELEQETGPEGLHLCPYVPGKGCQKICEVTCDYRPENFMDPETVKIFERTPWAVYCLDCGEFLESRQQMGHEGHNIATGVNDYRSKIAQAVKDRMMGKT